MGLVMFSLLVFSMLVAVVTVATIGEGHRDEAQRHGHCKQQCQPQFLGHIFLLFVFVYLFAFPTTTVLPLPFRASPVAVPFYLRCSRAKRTDPHCFWSRNSRSQAYCDSSCLTF